MSTYVKEKVLRIPLNKINMNRLLTTIQEMYPDDNIMDDLSFYLENAFPELFGYGDIGKFQIAPTVSGFIDYVLDYKYDCDGVYGKVRELYDSEKLKFEETFKKLDDSIDMNFVKLVEFCWYNGSEAPDYYDPIQDSFYREL